MAVNTFFPWRDGVGAVEYNNRLIMFGGWNPSGGVFTPFTTTSEIWQSYDNGATWTLLGNAPWSRRHSFSYSVVNGYLYIWGGDNFNGQLKDIWRFDDINGWVQITADWGVTGGNRIFQAGCAHKGELYMAGGQENLSVPTNNFNDIVKWNGSTWTNVGTLPISYFTAGVLLSDDTDLYIIGGGQYVDTGHTNFNNNIYKSSDDGATWTNIGSLGYDMTGVMFCNAQIFDNKIFFINGWDQSIPANKSGVWWSKKDCKFWVKIGNNTATHAAGITNPINNHFYIVSGNVTGSVWKVVK